MIFFSFNDDSAPTLFLLLAVWAGLTLNVNFMECEEVFVRQKHQKLCIFKLQA